MLQTKSSPPGLLTTVYNQGNAVITGCYFTAKGDRIDVEFMGSALECECYINAVRQDNEGTNEVQHVVNRVNVKHATPVATGFALHNQWHSVLAA